MASTWLLNGEGQRAREGLQGSQESGKSGKVSDLNWRSGNTWKVWEFLSGQGSFPSSHCFCSLLFLHIFQSIYNIFIPVNFLGPSKTACENVKNR